MPRCHDPGATQLRWRAPQAVVDYVAMTGEGRIFENSVEKGKARRRGARARGQASPAPR